ncbi:MAG: glycosyltransferase [Bacilli bacterium]|nr:glycosyltransferase [Bacilli bacterium]
MIKIAGVVVLYNPDVDYIANINSYIDYLDVLYVIDNSSKKNKVPDNKKIKYIFNNENIGVAKALNNAAKMAIDSKYKWLLTMDQDTKFKKGVMERMTKYIEDNNTDKDGILVPWHNTKLDIEKSKDDIDYPLQVMTSGNLVNLKAYQEVGGYNEDYFIDGIDIEYCLRLKKYGYRIVRFNDVEIDHDLGNIEYHKFLGKTYLCTNHNYIRLYYIVRNYRDIRKKYYDVAPEYCEILTHLKLRIFRVVMFEKDKYRKLRNMYRGARDYKKGIIGKYPYKN